MGAFNILQKENEKKLKTILDNLLKKNSTYTKGSNEQLLSDFYQSALDSNTINRLGFKPILKDWNQIDGLQSIKI
jgi:putative endopeptidase